MNKRAIYKKVLKRKNNNNDYYCYVRIILPKGKLLNNEDYVIGVGANWWQCKDDNKDYWILQMKPWYLKYDLTCLINNLNKTGLDYKLR